MQLYLLLSTSAADKWSTGGITTLLGLGMTFIMLALLVCFIHLLRYILNFLEKTTPAFKEKIYGIFRKKNNKGLESNISNGTNNNTTEELVAENNIDNETMEVIEQSVKQYISLSADDGKPHDRIKIVSVKEVNND